MFMAVKLEDRKAIIDILDQTPAIPEICQWCIFLRNHDELTLEMVTEIERDYMYDNYAADKAMRINVGIRRRLAPMMENDRRRIELMNGLLLSMPGTPVIYYGDEIGMGTTYISATGMVCARQCSGTGDGTAGFPRPIRSGCIRR